MRPVALLLAIAVALSASPAVAEETVPHQRGFLTGLGLGFLVLGGVGTGLGIGGTLTASQADASLAKIGPPTKDNVDLIAALDTERRVGSVLGVVGFVVAVGSFITGIVLFVKDRPAPPVTVVVMPLQQGGMFALSANF